MVNAKFVRLRLRDLLLSDLLVCMKQIWLLLITAPLASYNKNKQRRRKAKPCLYICNS